MGGWTYLMLSLRQLSNHRSSVFAHPAGKRHKPSKKQLFLGRAAVLHHTKHSLAPLHRFVSKSQHAHAFLGERGGHLVVFGG